MLHLDRALPALIDNVVSVRSTQSVGGGCISEAAKVAVEYESGQLGTLFVKSNRDSFLDNFQAEWDGLLTLARPGAIDVPEPTAVGIVADRSYLVAKWIESGPPTDTCFDLFGRQLATLHRETTGDRIGFDRDNYLGAAVQPNASRTTWCEVVADQRIGFQLRWAVDQGLADAKLRRDCQQIIDSMEPLLDGRESATSLLHGDLWSGNYLCQPDGRPAIIDPAAYYGCREAEFGMLELFGSCPESFYHAYDDQFPLPSGWQRRTNIYVLYHLLNHLNLFGRGYHDQCRSVAANILLS